MEISLQRDINYYSIHTQRRNMIYAENLHMLDKITYDRFKQLYFKYAPNIDEKDFARYFLDIDYISYYKLLTRKSESSILEREFYREEEFSKIAYRIFIEKEFKNISVDYETLINLHKEYGDRFSLKQFAEEVFGINSHRVDDIKANSSKKANIKLLDMELRNSISKVRKKVILEAGLHIGMQISLEEFNNLYQAYGVNEIEEKIFAHKVLGITEDTFLRFKKGKRDKVIILQNFPINPEYIVKLREKVIISEHLCVDDAIDNEGFYNLYNKYGGILTEELFAEEILDISWEAVKKAKRSDHKNKVLGKLSVSEDDLSKMREFIMKKHSLKYNQLLDYNKLNKLYKHYGFPLSEVQFAKRILKIPYEEYYYELKNGKRKSCYVFVDTQDIDFCELRKIVIEKEELHYSDKIDYKKLQQLHKKYAPTMRESDFARKILDISEYCFCNIKAKRNQSTTILLEEQLPMSKQLEKIQECVIIKYNLSKGQAINHAKFKKMYKTFGGIMPEDMFAKEILYISEQNLNDLKSGKNINILLGTNITAEKIEIIKNSSDEKKDKLLEKVKIIFECYISSDKNVNTLKMYIKVCEYIFEKGEFNFDELSLLKEAIQFIQGNIDEIKIYVKICSSRELYKEAINFIYDNIDNKGITQQSKDELTKIGGMLKISAQEKNIVDMYNKGKSLTEIANKTNLPEEKITKLIKNHCKKDISYKENSEAVSLE